MYKIKANNTEHSTIDKLARSLAHDRYELI